MASLAVLALVSACGGTDKAAEKNGVTEVKVALIPSATKAVFYLALEKGYFTSRGLDVTPVPLQDGAAVTAAVTSGDAQIGAQALAPAVTAVSKGVPLKAFAGDETAPRPASDKAPYGDAVVLVRKGSPIKSAADLNGKTVAVNALRAGVELALRGALDTAGADSASVKMLPLPFPDMQTALDGGRVDAIAALEPFVQVGINAGSEVLLNTFPYPADTGVDDFLASLWFSSTNYAGANPRVLEKFRAALAQAGEDVVKNPEEVGRILPTFTKITPEAAKNVWVAEWSATIDPEAYDAAVDLMVKYKFIDEAVPLKQFATADSYQ